ncbi:hypothetical protein ACFVZ3_09050 [Kitasatospora purpeofusca]|uniref:hypothetical protein n=1 Tax=Kitasatospora purpeofusca TaxID=67352 RepID=UPI0036B976F8
MPPFLDNLARRLRAVLPAHPSRHYLAALRLAAPRRPGAEVFTATSTLAPTFSEPGQYQVAVLLNVALGPGGVQVNFDGFQDGHELAVASPTEGSPLLILTITAQDLPCAADRAFVIGNRQDTDDNGVEWPADLRSVSVGDVLHTVSPSGHQCYLAVAPRGFTHIDPPRRDSIVALAGSSATSRV